MVARIETPLRRILRDEGRTQAWLARRLGVSRQRVGQWSYGINVPVEATRVAISDALGRPVDELWPEHGQVEDHTSAGTDADEREAA